MTNSLTKLVQKDSPDAFYIDLIKHELEWQLYDYGDHMTHKGRRGSVIRKADIIVYLKFFRMLLKKQTCNEGLRVLNYVPFSFDKILLDNGFLPYSLPQNARRFSIMVKSWRLINYKYKIDKIIRKHDFNQIINEDIICIKNFYDLLKSIIIEYDFKALLVLTDQSFLERTTIAIFNELGKKSFLFSHGIPGKYDLENDNRTDFLMVWGDAVKRNFLNVGFNLDKIVVVGNAKYKKFSVRNLKWDDSRIVVVPESSIIWHQQGYHDPYVPDRSRIIIYLYEVELILKKLGYQKAYYRPHPSIERAWVNKFIDKHFYQEDFIPLGESISAAKLVIGATSTVMLEYLMSGVNFIVYERNPINKLFPPFDGTDERVPFANSPEMLESIIKNKAVADPSLVNDYMKPLAIDKIITTIKENTK